MNENVALERMLTTYMADEAAGRAPERLLDDVLSATSRARSDPRWLALLKEPPMRTQTRVVVGTPTRRLVLAMVAVAVLLLVLAAAIVGANLLRPPQRLASDDWPMFRGDSTHAGLTNHGPKGHPLVQWQFRTNGPVQQSLAIVGDTVYVPTDFGFVHAIGVADGVERWNKQFVSYPLSGVVVADGLVLVTDGQGLLYGLDPKTGTERWHSTGTAPGGKNPSVGEGAMYVGTEEGYLVAFDTKDGRERWRAFLGGGGSINNSAYADGLVYVATEKAGFLAVDAQTGSVRWTVDVEGDQTGTPVVADGIAYIGAGADSTVGHLRAVDAKTGQKIWTLKEPIGSPTLANGVAFAQAPANAFQVALDPKTGTELWRSQLGGPGTVRAAVVADGVVYIPHDGKQRIYALDARTGGEIWRYDLNEGNTCCLAVAKGSIFVGTDQGNVYRIGGDGAELSPAPVVRSPAATTASPSASAP
jgi:serine/threonine-protein kinase